MREESGSPRTERLKRRDAESKSSFCALPLRARPRRGGIQTNKRQNKQKIALCKSPSEHRPGHLAAKRTPVQLLRPPQAATAAIGPPDLHKEPADPQSATPETTELRQPPPRRPLYTRPISRGDGPAAPPCPPRRCKGSMTWQIGPATPPGCSIAGVRGLIGTGTRPPTVGRSKRI